MNYYVSDSLIAAIALLIVWEFAWKIAALIKAAKAKDWFWFRVILIINSVGILPILYIFYGKKFVGVKTQSKR